MYLHRRCFWGLLLLGGFCLLPGFSGDEHAFYLSVMELSMTAEGQTGALTVKVFSDDLEDALFHEEGLKRGIRNAPETSAYRPALTRYFNRHILLKINGQEARLKWEKGEKEQDTHWLYFTFPTDSPWQTLDLKADYFMELFPSQTQVVKIQGQGPAIHARLSPSQPVFRHTF